MDRKIFYQEERLAMFIDGANLYAAARSLGFDIDYKRLLELFAGRGRLVRAFYYTALVEDQEYSPIRPLVDWLDYNGYTMVTKPTKEYTDASGRRKIKGNMDIELAIDVMEMAEHVDHILLFSGDGDFRRLVEAVQRKGVRVTVISTVRSTPPMVADELRRQADNFLELQDLSPNIMRTHSPRFQNQGGPQQGGDPGSRDMGGRDMSGRDFGGRDMGGRDIDPRDLDEDEEPLD
ncbi:NYN domain-containing protein [Rhodocista pekingensis]|uniref:NYN domain-containing protein n=1 Tax=Rhodocista pekingensis TaxID=201185 RepID=A0ABW2KUS3_9PROT